MSGTEFASTASARRLVDHGAKVGLGDEFTAEAPGRIDAGDAAADLDLDFAAFLEDGDEGEPIAWELRVLEDDGIFRSAEIDPASGLLALRYQPFMSGEALLELVATDTAGNFAVHQVTVVLPPHPSPGLEFSTDFVLNRQTGLLERVLRVTNASARDIGGFDLRLWGLADGIELNNASGRDGEAALVHHRQPLAGGATVELMLEFFSPDRRPPGEPELEASATLPAEPDLAAEPGEAAFAIDRSERLADGSFLIEFSAVAGRRYEIQYSHDGQEWFVSPVPVTAAANRVQWIDRGMPRTSSAPGEVGQRLYRVRLLP